MGPLGKRGAETDVTAVRCEDADRIHLTQDSDPVPVNTVMNLGFG